jgi:hypothetical protein
LHKLVTGCIELQEVRPLKTNKQLLSDEFILIAHAGGSLPGRININTLEALNYSVKSNYKFIEVDINMTIDSSYVLAHDFVEFTLNDYLEDKSNGTNLSLTAFLKWLEGNEVKIITDIKLDNLKVLRKISANFPHLRAKILPQVYTISEINEVQQLQFENIIFTNYVAGYPPAILKKLAYSKSISAIAIPYNNFLYKFSRYSSLMENSPVPIYTHTINDLDQLKSAKVDGISGVYTDYILPRAIH